jgi:putative holliday junction resolvase
MRYVAIDLGDKRTGLAIGDTITGVVTPLDVLEVPVAVRGGEALLEALAKAVEAQLGVGAASAKAGLVVGLPINMDDSEGPRAKQVRAFAGRIAAKTGFVVEFQDERLTSAEADWSMARSGMTRQEKKQRRDALAAATILRDFLRGKMSPLADGEDRVFDA